jgi:hypothetical protein
MKIWKIITIVALTLTAVTLVTASAFAYMGGQGFYSPYGAYSNGMMGGHMGYSGSPQNAYPTQPNGPAPTTPTYPYQNGGGGCMRSGMNGYVGSAYSNNGPATITIDTAVTVAQRYLASLNNPDLAIDEVEEYTQNFYVLYYEKSTGIGAFEMLIDKYNGNIYSEMGPNMMWNTKYGMMSAGMMGTYRTTPTAVMPITVDQAKASAQQFLNANLPGTTVGDVTVFYGYYHVDLLLSGNTYGMLSVNGYTGQVWYHNWHGNFVQQVEL